ncbi:TPA: hypothetical protein I7730_00220 [Vibrio vulnificus]|uniref:Uncharacterized protein n=1 Tax=Vibrio vulnificus TaxID=672 RepID=A0A8H9K5I8_VIBVL|nr:hypothetical protein [Vibrio vulnificus]
MCGSFLHTVSHSPPRFRLLQLTTLSPKFTDLNVSLQFGFGGWTVDLLTSELEEKDETAPDSWTSEFEPFCSNELSPITELLLSRVLALTDKAHKHKIGIKIFIDVFLSMIHIMTVDSQLRQ